MAKISRAQIIDVTAQLIEKTANSNPSITQIAEKLGITHAALYKHFTNKNDLLTAVADQWFQQQVLTKIKFTQIEAIPSETLHNYIWQFALAKKAAYQADPVMFQLNTQYIDSHPLVLRQVLQSFYGKIDQLMGYQDPHHEHAEAILAAFAIFTLPSFKTTWYADDYQARFEQLWRLIKPGLTSNF